MSARELITEYLDLWTGAVTKKSSSGRGSNGKIELTGVKKLRELILELAVRGKLVEQNPLDESAQLVLERIEKEIEQEVRTGQRKKPKPVPAVSEHETPFAIPSNWQWVRLGRIAETHTGFAFKTREYTTDGTFVLRVTNINQDGTIETSDSKYITPEAAETTYSKFQLKESDILLVMVGGSLGKIGIVDSHVLPAVLNQNMWKFQLYGPMSKDYFVYGLKHINANQIAITNSTHGHLSQSSYLSKLFPLPPAEEQHRIVQKVDDLMALCDRLGQQTSDQLEAHETLVDTLLATLTHSENATELADNWARLAAHFDTLFTTEQSIDKLKQTILQLAVMGRLVEQDAGDEPGGALVARMLETREHLATNEGMRTKAGNEVPSNEKYLSLPDSWAWVRLGNMAKFIDYRGKTPTKTASGKRLITAKNIRQGYIDLEPEEFISEEDYTKWMTRGFPGKGDLLFTPEAPLGNAAIVDLNGEFALAQRAICFQWHVRDTTRFMLIQIMASPFQTKLVENATGMTATGIKASKLKEIPVAIPPLKEQHRIVQKVDELMALCDHLKERLSQAGETRCQLAEAVVDSALN